MRNLTVLLLTLPVVFGFGSAMAQKINEQARPWQIHSFFGDIDLIGKSVIGLDFSPDGSVWLAVSDGLYHFDGYRWKRFTVDDGLPSNYVRCVRLASDGRLWIGTDRGAGTFDGRSFDFNGTEANLAGPSVRRIVEDVDGSIWFCCDQWPAGNVSGGLTRLQDGKFTTWRREDGLPSDYVSDYVRTRDGRQFVLTNKGLAEFSGPGFREPLKEAGLWSVDNYVWSLVESKTHGVIASTNEHFYQFDGQDWRRVPNAIPSLSQPKLLTTRDGEVYSCTYGHHPTIYRWQGSGFTKASRRLTGIDGSVEMLAEDPLGAIWIVGVERLLRWERTSAEWSTYEGVGVPRLKDCSGGIWFDAPGDGLYRYADDRWDRFAAMSGPLVEDHQGQVWIQAADGLARWRAGKELSRFQVPRVPHPKLIGVDGQGTVWCFGVTDDELPAVCGFDGEKWSTSTLPQYADHRVCCSASTDPAAGICLLLGKNRFPPFHLVHVDATGVSEIPLPDRAQVSEPPGVLARPDGTLLIAGFFGLLERSKDGQTWSEVGTPSPAVSGLVELKGETWISFTGQAGGRGGVSRFRGGVWLPFLQHQGAVVGRDRDEEFYLARHGVVQIISAGVDGFRPALQTPFEARATMMVAGTSGEYWLAVGNRTFRYVPDKLPPQTEILAGDSTLYDGERMVLQVRGVERFKPRQLARNYNVSIQVDDGDWTPFESLKGKVEVPRMGLGHHRVGVRVQDAAGALDATPAIFECRVLPIPLQSRAWFKPAVVACFAMMLSLAILASANWRKVRRLADGLEQEVVQKTSRLGASERKYRMLFEESQDAICLFGRDGTLQIWNESASNLLGFDSGNPFMISDLFGDGNEEARFQKELRRQGHLRGMRFLVRRHDDSVFDAILSVNVRTEGDESFSGYQVIVRDVSDLVRLQERLSETQKMEAVGRMAGGIAHDFNNFLTVVMYGAELVRLNSEKNVKIDKGVQMILDATERGKNLTSQIQTFSRAPATNLKVIDPHQVLSGIYRLLDGIVPPDVELVVDSGTGLGHIYGDVHQLEQVVINLAVNACHAMPGGGTLTIRASHITIDDSLADRLGVDSVGRCVLLQVIDTGIGMDDATCDRVFDPFFTTKPLGEGTGLGLAIVYGIIQQFRGWICVNSRCSEGTRFDMYFPSVEEEVRFDASEASGIQCARGTETVLLVEDESRLRELASGSLNRYGYNVLVAEDAAAAREIIRHQREIDLVVSDVVMRGTSGFDLAGWIRENRPEIAILLISGYPQTGVDEAPAEMVAPLLMKPFHPAVLALRIRSILDSRSTSMSV